MKNGPHQPDEKGQPKAKALVCGGAGVDTMGEVHSSTACGMVHRSLSTGYAVPDICNTIGLFLDLVLESRNQEIVSHIVQQASKAH
jgi:hypothetical protein